MESEDIAVKALNIIGGVVIGAAGYWLISSIMKPSMALKDGIRITNLGFDDQTRSRQRIHW